MNASAWMATLDSTVKSILTNAFQNPVRIMLHALMASMNVLVNVYLDSKARTVLRK